MRFPGRETNNTITDGSTVIYEEPAAGSNGFVKGKIEGNTVSNLDQYGIWFFLSSHEGDIVNNIANGNGVDGISIFVPVDGKFDGNISGNQISNSGAKAPSGFGGHGLSIIGGSTTSAVTTFDGDISNNVAPNNKEFGLNAERIFNFDGSVTGNRIEDNSSHLASAAAVPRVHLLGTTALVSTPLRASGTPAPDLPTTGGTGGTITAQGPSNTTYRTAPTIGPCRIR